MNYTRVGRWFTATIGLAVFLLGVLPVSNWIPGGLTDPGYTHRWREWLLGSLICLGVGVVCMVVVSEQLGGCIRGVRQNLGERLRSSTRATDAAVAAGCFVVYLIASQGVLSGRPLLIDELVQVLQARTYAQGALSTPVDSARAFFSVLHVVDVGERMYSQFPPGWPAMLVVPSLLGMEWVTGPLCGFVAVFVFARLLRRVFVGAHALVVPAGALLFGLAPFPLFQFASHMSHGPVLMWLLIAVLSLSSALDGHENIRSKNGLLAGFALGCAFAVRPLDAIAFAVPFFVALLARGVAASHLRVLAAVIVGGSVPSACVMLVNALTTGHPLTFGYETLWGAAHGLGFHEAPWGDTHTPERGLELLSTYVTRLNVYLFESPFPALLPAIAGLLFATRLTWVEWLLLSGSVAHAALYFAYWHDGFYLGPRFVLPWIPIVIILSIHGVRRIAGDVVSFRWKSGLAGAGVAALVLALASRIPERVSQYRSGLSSMRTDYSAEAAKAGVANAIVFVRESWGARLVARLWALGLSRPVAESLYSSIDACVLEHAITALERGSTRGIAAEHSLRPLLRDSSRVRASTVSPDDTERWLPGALYDAECSARVLDDQKGFALLPPLFLEKKSGNQYVRDLLAADSIIIDRNPGKRYFVLSRDGTDVSAPLLWTETTRALVVNGSVTR